MNNDTPTPTERVTVVERHFEIAPQAKVNHDDLLITLYNVRELAVAFERVYFDEMEKGQQSNVFGAMSELVGQAILLAQHLQAESEKASRISPPA